MRGAKKFWSSKPSHHVLGFDNNRHIINVLDNPLTRLPFSHVQCCPQLWPSCFPNWRIRFTTLDRLVSQQPARLTTASAEAWPAARNCGRP